jgi:hypothetical protein
MDLWVDGRKEEKIRIREGWRNGLCIIDIRNQ